MEINNNAGMGIGVVISDSDHERSPIITDGMPLIADGYNLIAFWSSQNNVVESSGDGYGTVKTWKDRVSGIELHGGNSAYYPEYEQYNKIGLRRKLVEFNQTSKGNQYISKVYGDGYGGDEGRLKRC